MEEIKWITVLCCIQLLYSIINKYPLKRIVLFFIGYVGIYVYYFTNYYNQYLTLGYIGEVLFGISVLIDVFYLIKSFKKPIKKGRS